MYMLNQRRVFKMNGKEFIKAVDNIVKEKGIDKEVVFEAMEQALATAYKKNFNSLINNKVIISILLSKEIRQSKKIKNLNLLKTSFNIPF